MGDLQNLEQYLFCDVWDAFFYDSNGTLLMSQENLTSADVTSSSDSQEVRNGRGNGLFATLMYNKKVDVSLKTNTFNMSLLALLCGTTVATGKGTAFTPVEYTDVNKEDGTATLKKNPIKQTDLKLYCDGVLINAEKYSLEGKVITFTDETVKGKTVKVLPYEFDCQDTNLKTITVDVDKFPSAGRLVLQSVVKNSETKNKFYITLVCEKAQPSSSFSLTTSSEVKPTETEVKLSVQTKEGTKQLVKIQFREIEE